MGEKNSDDVVLYQKIWFLLLRSNNLKYGKLLESIARS